MALGGSMMALSLQSAKLTHLPSGEVKSTKPAPPAKETGGESAP